MNVMLANFLNFPFKKSLIKRLKKKVEKQLSHPLATTDSVYSGLPYLWRMNRFLTFSQSARESPQNLCLDALGFSREEAGMTWWTRSVARSGADLGPLLCHVTEIAGLLRGDGSVNVQDRTLSNVCPQAKTCRCRRRRYCKQNICHLQVGCACLNKDYLRVPTEMLFK